MRALVEIEKGDWTLAIEEEGDLLRIRIERGGRRVLISPDINYIYHAPTSYLLRVEIDEDGNVEREEKGRPPDLSSASLLARGSRYAVFEKGTMLILVLEHDIREKRRKVLSRQIILIPIGLDPSTLFGRSGATFTRD